MYQILSESNNCRKSFAICQIKILSVSFHLRLSLFVITTVNVNICFHKSKQKRENISQAAIQMQSKRHHEPNRDTSRKIFRLHCTMLPTGIYNLRKRPFRCRPGMYAIFARDVRHPGQRWRTSPDEAFFRCRADIFTHPKCLPCPTMTVTAVNIHTNISKKKTACLLRLSARGRRNNGEVFLDALQQGGDARSGYL